MDKIGVAGSSLVLLLCLVLSAQAVDYKKYQMLLEGVDVSTSHAAEIPYGVYHLHNKYKCDDREKRCDWELSWSGYNSKCMLNAEDPVAYELVSKGDNTYKMYSLYGCPTNEMCKKCVGASGDQVKMVSSSDGLLWSFFRSTDLSKPNQWRIREQTGNRYLSFYGELAKLSTDDEKVEWELWIDINYVDQQIFTDVIYDLDNLNREDRSNNVLGSKNVINHNSNEDVSTIEIDYEICETSSFSNSVGTSVGIETTFKVGVPLISSAEVSISSETSYTNTWGEETSKCVVFVSSDSVKVAPDSSLLVTVEATSGVIDVPYKASLIIMYSTGEEHTGVVEGIYEGANVFDVTTVIQESTPLRLEL